MHVGPQVHTSRENHCVCMSIVDVWPLAAGARDPTDGYEIMIPWIDDRCTIESYICDLVGYEILAPEAFFIAGRESNSIVTCTCYCYCYCGMLARGVQKANSGYVLAKVSDSREVPLGSTWTLWVVPTVSRELLLPST
jgi:hypothetical protein